jgi:transcriptional regulator with XRE-family HTH domain
MRDDCNVEMGRQARKLVAQKLRLLRVLRGWSQERMAAASGLHRTYISLVERSACSVSVDSLEKIADALGVTPADMLGTPDAAQLGEQVARALAPPGRRKGRKGAGVET